MENKQAQEDIENLRLEMNTLLNANSQTNSNLQRQRQPQGSAAVAAILGSGIRAGDKLPCFIKSVYGGCDKRAARNQENIKRAMNYFQYLTDHVEKTNIQYNEKFYVVSGELEAINEAQYELIETQNRNWDFAESKLGLCDRMYIKCASEYNICMFESKSTDAAKSLVIFFKQFWRT